MPIVADCAAVRQKWATSAIGWGSLTESAKRDPRVVRGGSSFSVRRCPALLLPNSMALLTGEVPFGCPAHPQGDLYRWYRSGLAFQPPLSEAAQVVAREAVPTMA